MRRMEHNIILSTDYMPMYNKIPIDKRNLAASISGFKSCSSFVKSKYMSRHYYNKFKDFYEHISKDKQSPNTVGEPVEFDLEQLTHYYKELNNWIESNEYTMSSKVNRNKVVSEQLRISKLLTTKNK